MMKPVTETKNNTGKAHQIFYTNDWQYCFCSMGQNHLAAEKFTTTKENNHG